MMWRRSKTPEKNDKIDEIDGYATNLTQLTSSSSQFAWTDIVGMESEGNLKTLLLPLDAG